MADAREDLAWDRRAKAVRGGDSAPPRLSVQGFRSLATLLHERVRADEVRSQATTVLIPTVVPGSSYTSTCGVIIVQSRVYRCSGAR